MLKGADIRDEIIFKTLQEELVGPCAYGDALEISTVTFIPYDKFNHPFVTSDSKEEILKKVYPTQRYGVGVIYPLDSPIEEDIEESSSELPVDNITDEVKIDSPNFLKDVCDKNYDFDISLTNTLAPSAIGLSFLLNPKEINSLVFSINGAFYQDFTASTNQEAKAFEELWWYRKPISINVEIDLLRLYPNFKINLGSECIDLPDENLKGFYLEGVVRNHQDNLLFTVSLVNRNICTTFIERNRSSLFQSVLSLTTPNESLAILPYPESIRGTSDDISNLLLYRHSPVFSRGHGVASDWNSLPYKSVNKVSKVFTVSLPSFETPSVSADIELPDLSILSIEMKALSEIEDGSVGDIQLCKMLESYDSWIKEQQLLIEQIEQPELKLKAQEHIESCIIILNRMEDGYSLIKSSDSIRKAFQLANLAMYEQQKHAPKDIRNIHFDERGHIFLASPYRDNKALGKWRPFQIGFLLMCLKGVSEKDSIDRVNVELIWFPTGGGKTEAYLGLVAFILLFQRIVYGEKAEGVQAIMRYTLRLLTAQQLQRAATLICCLEVIRAQNRLAGQSFSIGLWVGGSNTPNKRKSALSALTKLKSNVKNGRRYDNPFLLDRCPYCSAQIGIAKNKNKQEVVGYHSSKEHQSVIFACTDSACYFSNFIPVIVIDEDIYDHRPSVVIGTVDKFAMLAWQPKIRNLFGIGDEGKRISEPPQLIIQDELHLISGPLGSMVALYEPLIEKLCSYELNGKVIKPKIVCATATTKGYKEQILGIYGRENVTLFPAPGLNAEDSFFSKYQRDENGMLSPGRKYVGVCAPGLGSILTTQVRTQSALLFAPNRVEVEMRDPWVTLLSFYNSIRELGGALTLFQSDIVSYLLEQKRRYPRSILPRKFLNGRELTSRLSSDEIPIAIADLEKPINSDILTEFLFENIKKELQVLQNKYSELEPYVTAIVNSIDINKRIKLGQYHDLECISNYLKGKGVKLPECSKRFYDLCLNYYVKSFCLASSIIEVGVDIDRLAVMSIIGQPKTTAQYIQVSGRVGRRVPERPGLVVTIYNNSKPRDKSHYEDFRGYHQRLYAKVEPSSVTPFSRPALKRGLAAITIAALRQFSPIDTKPENIDISLLQKWILEFIELREIAMSDDELKDVKDSLNRFLSSWTRRIKTLDEWGKLTFNGEVQQNDLLFPLGLSGNFKGKLPCPTSMRNVDGESSMWITDVYSNFDDFGDWDV
jgi:hypothetical protein